MIYYRQKIDSFTDLFDACSVIVLSGKNHNLLLKDAKKISDTIAGPEANDEMRITRFFNQEINGKRDEIFSSMRTKSFFPGTQIILLNGLSEKDYKIIIELDSEWQEHDAVCIVTTDELSKNSEFKKLLASSPRMALVNYESRKMNSRSLRELLAKEGITLNEEEVLESIIEFSNFTNEEILENELAKLKLYKLYDKTPLKMEDFFNIISIDYEVGELNLAVAIAERTVLELEKMLNMFFLRGKSPISILQFVSAYFNKLSLIKLYGPTSFEARREYPFLVSDDLEKAKNHLKKWTSEQLSFATGHLTVSDLKLRKHPTLFQRSILTQSLHKLIEI